MKKLVCKSQEDLAEAAKVAESIIKDTLYKSEDFNIKVENLGVFATLDVTYKNCCEISEFNTKRVFKAFCQIQKTYKGVFYSVGAEKYFEKKLNAYLYRPVFHLSIPSEERKTKK